MSELRTLWKQKNGLAVDIPHVMTSYSSWIQHVMKMDSVVIEARYESFEAEISAVGSRRRRALA
jgi:hypothetical protein